MKHLIGPLSLFEAKKKHKLMLNDIPYLAVKIGEGIYVIPDTCPHQDASLSLGSLEGEEIVCPLHRARFNVVTGAIDDVSQMLYFDGVLEKITTHKAVIESELVYLDI